MFANADKDEKSQFLDKNKYARDQRMFEKKRQKSALIIQSLVRRFLTRAQLINTTRNELDNFISIPHNDNEEESDRCVTKPASELFFVIKRFLFIFKKEEDARRYEYLCKYILDTLNSDITKNSYTSLVLSKNLVLPWLSQLKSLLWISCQYLQILKPESSTDLRLIITCLSFLLSFTSSNWKILKSKSGESLRPAVNQMVNNIMGDLNVRGMYPCFRNVLTRGLGRSKPALTPLALSAIINIALRPLAAADFSDNLMIVFTLNILSVPALIYHLSSSGSNQDSLSTLMTHQVFTKTLSLLSNTQTSKIVFNALEGNYALCLLANLIQLGNIEVDVIKANTDNFIWIVCQLLERCKVYVKKKKSNLTHWHPVLGWFSQKTDQNLHDSMPFVVNQLRLMWSIKFMRLLMQKLFAYSEKMPKDSTSPLHRQSSSKQSTSSAKIMIKKALEKASPSGASKSSLGNHISADDAIVKSTCSSCRLYLTAISTLTQLRLDILTGLCCQDILLPKLWQLIGNLGENYGLKTFIDKFSVKSSPISEANLSTSCTDNDHVSSIFDLLVLTCDTSCHIFVILDDIEVYEEGKPLPLSHLESISYFLNHFIYKIIWNNIIDLNFVNQHPVFVSTHNLLMLLYERDSRQSFTAPNHWLIREAKSCISALESEKHRLAAEIILQKIPHVITHKERVVLFRKYVSREKESLGLVESTSISPQSTLITVHRSRITEDGYRQLAALPVNALKGLIRVKFINEQGLDEAGIDQDGVFKEYLEETINTIFNPSLNLFKATSGQKLYPSPTSYIQDNHLSLFEFVGRMLGKAVYEGIVVEVPFAPFFISQILSQNHNATYSSIDELPSLDPDLYKSLTYVKHYSGDVSDLELSFAYDEDVMGKLTTHELLPGGRVTSVNNDNKISYIHLMAHFRMRVQIREQTNAFIRGFRSIVNINWLQMFSGPELQKLISGDTADIDLDDLRRHTQYYGGFHNNHKIINWLWAILSNDFTCEERKQFLRFVTSCSKPPLLGFQYLEPSFSIRCVEVSDDQDTGDTVGTVLKGFFGIRRGKDHVGRLPTSSTCFNLLKLPNYNKRSILREKLRYAITSNTGFELS